MHADDSSKMSTIIEGSGDFKEKQRFQFQTSIRSGDTSMDLKVEAESCNTKVNQWPPCPQRQAKDREIEDQADLMMDALRLLHNTVEYC